MKPIRRAFRSRPSSLPRLGLVAALALLAGLAAPAATGAAPEPPAGEGVVVQRVDTPAAEVKSSWTREDFENAIPAEASPNPQAILDVPSLQQAGISARSGDFVVNNPTKLPQRLHGKVFFRKGNLIYTCSGTLVSSRFANAVYTAGHCVFDFETKAFVSDFIFVPGYNQGTGLGLYPATTLATTAQWARSGRFSGDIGIATLSGTPSYDMGGARPVNFNAKVRRRKVTLYGYPGDPAPFDGVRLFGCNSRIVARDDNYGRPFPLAARPCHMGHGASGGGWISHRYLISVNSYIYCETTPRLCGYSFGPYFGKAARKLYTLPQVGGSVDPVITIRKHPKRVTSKRRVKFRFLGLASTPLNYWCKFDRRRWQRCKRKTSISRLSRGRHTLRVKAHDQTGRRTVNTPRFRFKVKR